MSIQTPNGTVFVGKTDRLTGFAISAEDFKSIGDQLLTTNRDVAAKGFPYAVQLFSGKPVQLDSLDAFLLMEDLDILLGLGKTMTERDQNQLLMIYNNVKYEVYNEQRATISL